MKEKFGVTPDQVVDVLALMGDTIDNIKGVPGIGEKGARDLISTYGTLDALLEHAAEVPQKKYREALLAHADEARSSRELLRIQTDVPVEFDISAFRYRGPTREACFELFSELGFRSLVMEYAPTADTTAKDYRLVDHGRRSSRRWPASCARPGGSALRVLPDGAAAVARRHRRSGVSPARHRASARVRAGRHRTDAPAEARARAACSATSWQPTRDSSSARCSAPAGPDAPDSAAGGARDA